MRQRRSLGEIFIASALILVGFGSLLAKPGLGGDRREDKRSRSDFGVTFSDCEESIGVGLVAIEQMRALVPPEFQLVGEGSEVTPIVVRTFRGSISVDGRRPRSGKIVQIGAVIVPPDFTGDINNYTLWYYTSDDELARRLSDLGVPAQHVPAIDFEDDLSDPGQPSPFQVRVPRPGHPRLRVEGTVTSSGASAGSFEANWWFKAGKKSVKMNTLVPTILIGTADLTLKTRKRGPLGKLIGGDTLAFPLLQQFNLFESADMLVSRVSP